jgi:hypothetical protein
MWFGQVTSAAGSIRDALELLREAADRDVSALPIAPEIKRLAFAGAGWARSEPGGQHKPLYALVSNFRGSNDWLPKAQPAFSIITRYAPLKDGFDLFSAGVDLTRDERQEVVRAIRKRVSKGSSPSELLQILVSFVRRVADRDPWVGKSLLASSLPRLSVPAQYVVKSGAPDFTGPVYLFLADGVWDGVWHGPSYACGGLSVAQPIIEGNNVSTWIHRDVISDSEAHP